MSNNTCAVSGKAMPAYQLSRFSTIRSAIHDLMLNDYPSLKDDSYVSAEVLNIYRKKYLEQIIRQEKGEMSKLEEEVMNSISRNHILSTNIELDIEERLTPGQRMADAIADFGGSWTFIICFFSFLVAWIAVNILVLAMKPFDPYPFILLNLILSSLAAIQAPVIMMSQNRKEEKDRKRSEYDYKVNLKAELEIRLLHDKLDHLISHQNQRLLEIQEIQADYMEDILKQLKN